jgi:hypothetical protein
MSKSNKQKDDQQQRTMHSQTDGSEGDLRGVGKWAK